LNSGIGTKIAGFSVRILCPELDLSGRAFRPAADQVGRLAAIPRVRLNRKVAVPLACHRSPLGILLVEPMPSYGIFEVTRQRAMELRNPPLPPLPKKEWAVGCVEWQPEQDEKRARGEQ
jgi:hypothetical protein